MYNQGRGSGPQYWQQGNHISLSNDTRPSAQSRERLPVQPGVLKLPATLSTPGLPANPYAPHRVEGRSSLQMTASGGVPSSTFALMQARTTGIYSNHTILSGANVSSAAGGGNIRAHVLGAHTNATLIRIQNCNLMGCIYPPGYNLRKRKWDGGRGPDGDAASSVLVLQLKVNLDSPEAIAKWVEERRKRWPSTRRIEEKKQIEEDARARGALFPEEARFPRAKFASNIFVPRSSLSRFNRAHGRGRGRERVRGIRWGGRGRGVSGKDYADAGWGLRGRVAPRGRNNSLRIIHGLPARPITPPAEGQLSGSSDSESESSEITTSSSDSSSDSDMDPIADAVSSKPPQSYFHDDDDDETMETRGATTIPDDEFESQALTDTRQRSPSPLAHNEVSNYAVQRRPRRRQPQKPKNNLFSRTSRRTLLRNLLESEVQVTLSNLSQAIRFIVANDCLRNVELKPGDAEDERRKNEKAVVVEDAPTEEEPSATTGELVDEARHTADGPALLPNCMTAAVN